MLTPDEYAQQRKRVRSKQAILKHWREMISTLICEGGGDNNDTAARITAQIDELNDTLRQQSKDYWAQA